MRRWKWFPIVLALLIAFTVATPALAGAPGEGQKKTPAQGGNPPTGTGPATDPPPDGWQEYPARPSTPTTMVPSSYNQGGTVQMQWPPDLGSIFGWVGDNVNPGKWAADTMTGALTSLVRSAIGGLAQVVYFLCGRDVENPYAPVEPGSQAVHPTALGINIMGETPLGMTYGNHELWDTVGEPLRSGCLALMGLFLLWTCLRELIRSATGESHGFRFAENLRRMVVAVFLVGGGMWWITARLIDLNNIFCRLILSNTPTLDVLFVIQWDAVSNDLLRAGLIVETAIALIVLVVTLLILGGIMLSRIVLLNLLLAGSPLAGMTYAAEETEHIFSTWIKITVGTVFYQTISVLALRVFSVLLINAWEYPTQGHPLIKCALAIGAIGLAITAPPLLGFAMRGRSDSGRAITRVITTVASAG